MLVIPTEGKISWRNPPMITIAVIVLNCIVFFFFQSNDTEKTIESYTYYFKSGLSEIELPRYADYVESTDGEILQTDEPGTPSPMSLSIFMRMQRDSDFMDRLYKDTIITSEDPDYDEWKALRSEFEYKQSGIVSHRFGLIPKQARPVNFLTYMFLHGSIMHLLGNMIFLWIVGCVLEMGCGRIYYIIGYLLVGILSALFYVGVHHASYVPMIGASGAISGLMGAFTVLYATTRIRVFVSTGFYFDYFRIPAFILLPFWIGKEFFQYYAQGPEQVAYMAHAGGLIGGALLGVLGKQFFDESKKAFFDEKIEDPAPALMEAAFSRSARLDFDSARTLLQEVLDMQPNHREALLHLFRVDIQTAMQSKSQSNLHKSANRLLSNLIKDKGMADKVWEVYHAYVRAAAPSCLSPDLSVRLSAQFFETGHTDASEMIVEQLITQHPDHPTLPTAILRLIRGFEKLKTEDKVQQYTKILCTRFPMSHEARMLSNGGRC